MKRVYALLGMFSYVAKTSCKRMNLRTLLMTFVLCFFASHFFRPRTTYLEILFFQLFATDINIERSSNLRGSSNS